MCAHMASTTLPGANSSEHTHAISASDSGDIRAEFQGLLSGCGVYDLARRSKITVTGGDRVRWMNGMVTNNIRDLALGHGVYAFLLNAQGRIQGDLYVFQRGDSLLVDVEQEQREKILQLFDRYIIADDVEIADISDKVTAIGLTGPESRPVMARVGISAAELGRLQFAEASWQGNSVSLLRSSEEADESWQVWIVPEHASELWNALVQAGAAPTGAAALNLFRIARGIPQFGVDIKDRDLPQETGQTRALNFTKGCYLGQEIVERIRSRGAVHRLFTAFTVEGELPEPGMKIVALVGEEKEAEPKEVGEITSSAILPTAGGERAVALGYLRREAAEKDLRAGASR